MKDYKLQMFADEEAEGTEQTEQPEVKTYSQEEVDALFNSYKEEQAKIFDEKWDKKFAKYKEDEQKKINEAEKLATMTTEERMAAKADELQQRVNELEARENIAKMGAIARQLCSEAGITPSDAILSVLVSDDAEKTKGAVEGYIAAYKEDVQTGVQNALKGAPPKTGGTNTLTKEDILKVENREERQRLINENLALFQ